jgi:hypothetical protein
MVPSALFFGILGRFLTGNPERTAKEFVRQKFARYYRNDDEYRVLGTHLPSDPDGLPGETAPAWNNEHVANVLSHWNAGVRNFDTQHFLAPFDARAGRKPKGDIRCPIIAEKLFVCLADVRFSIEKKNDELDVHELGRILVVHAGQEFTFQLRQFLLQEEFLAGNGTYRLTKPAEERLDKLEVQPSLTEEDVWRVVLNVGNAANDPAASAEPVIRNRRGVKTVRQINSDEPGAVDTTPHQGEQMKPISQTDRQMIIQAIKDGKYEELRDKLVASGTYTRQQIAKVKADDTRQSAVSGKSDAPPDAPTAAPKRSRTDEMLDLLRQHFGDQEFTGARAIEATGLRRQTVYDALHDLEERGDMRQVGGTKSNKRDPARYQLAAAPAPTPTPEPVPASTAAPATVSETDNAFRDLLEAEIQSMSTRRQELTLALESAKTASAIMRLLTIRHDAIVAERSKVTYSGNKNLLPALIEREEKLRTEIAQHIEKMYDLKAECFELGILDLELNALTEARKALGD